MIHRSLCSAHVDCQQVSHGIWNVTNGALTVRHKNLTIMVLSPDDKRTQVAVANKILELL